MKISYAGAFDKEEDAQRFSSFLLHTFPTHTTQLFSSGNQLQLQWTEGGAKGSEFIGDYSGTEVFLVISIAP